MPALGASSLNLKNNYDTNATLVVDKSIKSGTFHATFTAKSSSGLTQSVTTSVTLTGK